MVQVHQSVLCSSSEFFRAKAKPEWSNGQATVDLRHISEEAFTIYATWAYGGDIVRNGRDLDEEVIPDNKATQPVKEDWQALAEAIALGEELMDKAFEHSVLDVMVYAAGTFSNKEVAREVMCHALPVQVIYDGTPEGSGARNLILDIFKRHKDFLEQCDDDLPPEFLKDLAMKLLKGEDKDKSGLAENPCWYHQHAEGEACYSTTYRDWKAEFGDKI